MWHNKREQIKTNLIQGKNVNNCYQHWLFVIMNTKCKHCCSECQRMVQLNSVSYKYDSHTTHKNQNNFRPLFGQLRIARTSVVQVLKVLWTDYLVGKGESIHWHDNLCNAGNLQIPSMRALADGSVFSFDLCRFLRAFFCWYRQF